MMKKRIIRIVILVLIFLGAIFIASRVANQVNSDMTGEMADASLPTVTLTASGYEVNQLYGYTVRMAPNYMRDTITPLDESMVLPVIINTYGETVEKIGYEVRSLDAERLVEQTELTDFDTDGEVIHTDLAIKNLLETGQEYILQIIISTSTYDEINYYTRIIRQDGLYAKECMDFITSFSENTFVEEDASQITTYLEPSIYADNGNFHKVGIDSSFVMVTWGELNVSKVYEPVVNIKEINQNTASFTLNYIVQRNNDVNETEYYQVEEFYRVRYTETRMYLLAYERTMEEIYPGAAWTFSDKRIVLGIGSGEIQYLASNDGSTAAFTQSGSLWSYDTRDNQLSYVFGFHNNRITDVRDSYNQHDIKLLRMDDTGSADFLVYGYMNRGNREGQSGISIYHYDSMTNSIEELAFVASDKPYQVLKEDIGRLAYINNSSILFLMLDNTIHRIDLNTRKAEILVAQISEDAFAVSDDHSRIAYDGTGEGRQIQVMDLENETEYRLDAERRELIRPLGFLETDFIYGAAREDDIISEASGRTLLPMYRIFIINSEQRVDKEYQQEGYYVTGIEIQDNLINLERLQGSGGQSGYTEAEDDQIIYNDSDEPEKVRIGFTVSDTKQRYYFLEFADEFKESVLQFLNPSEVLFQESRNIELQEETILPDKFYVYGRGRLDSSYTNAGTAISQANDIMGVVVTDSQKYVWERGNRQNRIEIAGLTLPEEAGSDSMALCLDIMLEYNGVYLNTAELLGSGQTALSILTGQLDAQAVDLKGCSLDEVLYFVSRGVPAFGILEGNQCVLLVGYDEYNVILFDPLEGTTRKMGLNDGNAAFEAAGNIFISYVE